MSNSVTPPNQNLKKYPIFAQSLNGLKSTLGKVFSDYGKNEIPTAILSNGWGQRELQQEFGEVTYPYMILIPVSIEKNSQSYNNQLAMRSYVPMRGKNNQIIRLRLVPVLAQFRISFIAQDYSDVIGFQESYLYRYKDVRFILKNDAIELGIRVDLSRNLASPEQAMEQNGNLFRVETDCTMHTYIGETETVMQIDSWSMSEVINNNAGDKILENVIATIKKGVGI